ncbi:hypothetical protein K490DRAFT_54100 [Saccharata proteae CBS 121410]|uniref:G-patch domain-containing protein n=1 Tax=Saccharata proteae CBS 121410 TaxID=1314787 RepID=A0A9P4I2A4_9PEZI|nr:hypothetical protein K490DRAFT_54100 [Saccharata proteae CBS 121410]
MDASALLTKQGWRGHGHSLDKNDRGIKRPLLVANKQNVLGVGKKKTQVADQWWMRAYDTGLKELGSGKETTLSQIQQNGINRGGLYGFFVRGEGLPGSITDTTSANTTSAEQTTPEDSSESSSSAESSEEDESSSDESEDDSSDKDTASNAPRVAESAKESPKDQVADTDMKALPEQHEAFAAAEGKKRKRGGEDVHEVRKRRKEGKPAKPVDGSEPSMKQKKAAVYESEKAKRELKRMHKETPVKKASASEDNAAKRAQVRAEREAKKQARKEKKEKKEAKMAEKEKMKLARREAKKVRRQQRIERKKQEQQQAEEKEPLSEDKLAKHRKNAEKKGMTLEAYLEKKDGRKSKKTATATTDSEPAAAPAASEPPAFVVDTAGDSNLHFVIDTAGDPTLASGSRADSAPAVPPNLVWHPDMLGDRKVKDLSKEERAARLEYQRHKRLERKGLTEDDGVKALSLKEREARSAQRKLADQKARMAEILSAQGVGRGATKEQIEAARKQAKTAMKSEKKDKKKKKGEKTGYKGRGTGRN